MCIEDLNVREQFENLTEKLYGAKRGISKKIGLMDACILLSTIGDELLDDDALKELKDHLNVRNELWIEHRDKLGTKENYINFRDYVNVWLSKAIEIDTLNELIESHRFVGL